MSTNTTKIKELQLPLTLSWNGGLPVGTIQRQLTVKSQRAMRVISVGELAEGSLLKSSVALFGFCVCPVLTIVR